MPGQAVGTEGQTALAIKMECFCNNCYAENVVVENTNNGGKAVASSTPKAALI